MLSLRYLFILLVFTLTACDDLNPSSADLRTPSDPNSIGANIGQIAPDFSLFDTEGNARTMSTELVSTDAIVLYFNMWCPICDSHLSHMRTQIIPKYPNVTFFIIDYVSGTVELSRASQLTNGYADMTVLVDNTQEVLALYEATMGTTVVIGNNGSNGTVLMNEDYKDGTRLDEILATLP